MKSILLGFLAISAAAAAEPAFEPLLIDRNQLETARQGGTRDASARIIAEADRLLDVRPPTVLDKTTVPASGDKHDYFSLGPYWWPDPSKPDGLPYVRRDGEVNPEVRRQSDTPTFGLTCRAIETLGTAYALTSDRRYAQKAAFFARTWFLDPTTRMNPNFQHAQAIPGITTGRGIGIIEGQNLMWANEGLALLGDDPEWTPADRAAMRTWNEAFYIWLTTSANGLEEKAWHNNHGSWYDAQVAHLALVIGRVEDARILLREGLTRRLAAHIEPDGSQPLELERTRSLSYSLYNLQALLICARLGERAGVDWWTYTTADGRSLGAALRFLAPFLDPAKPWIKPEVVPTSRERIGALIAAYLAHRDDPVLRAALQQHPPVDADRPWRIFDTASRDAGH
jgi:hypothetical protein